MDVNILTLKWGTKYGPEYVNRLHAGVRRHLTGDFRFLCFTDDPSDLLPEVETHPLPDFDVPPTWQRTPWLKLALFRDDLAGLRGQSLFLDLDILITGPMDDFFAFAPGCPCIIRDWEKTLQRLLRRHGAPGNSSVFRFESGRSGAILDRFMAERDRALAQYRTEVDQTLPDRGARRGPVLVAAQMGRELQAPLHPGISAQPLPSPPASVRCSYRRVPWPSEPARSAGRLSEPSSPPDLPAYALDRRPLALTASNSGRSSDCSRLSTR